MKATVSSFTSTVNTTIRSGASGDSTVVFKSNFNKAGADSFFSTFSPGNVTSVKASKCLRAVILKESLGMKALRIFGGAFIALQTLLGRYIPSLPAPYDPQKNRTKAVVHLGASAHCPRPSFLRPRCGAHSMQLMSRTSKTYPAETVQALLVITHSLGGFVELVTHSEKERLVLTQRELCCCGSTLNIDS